MNTALEQEVKKSSKIAEDSMNALHSVGEVLDGISASVAFIIKQLTNFSAEEKVLALKELQGLNQNIENIKDIIKNQQLPDSH